MDQNGKKNKCKQIAVAVNIRLKTNKTGPTRKCSVHHLLSCCHKTGRGNVKAQPATGENLIIVGFLKKGETDNNVT